MEKEEAHHLLALHSGRMGAFVEGYRFALRYKTGKREEKPKIPTPKVCLRALRARSARGLIRADF